MHLARGLLVLIAAFSCHIVNAASVTAIALFNDKAMLVIDSAKPKILKVGESYKGVTLVNANTDGAEIELDGQRKTLRLNGTAVLSGLGSAPIGSGESKTITLYENQAGFYMTRGYIDGVSTRFLVDTGANIVVFNSQVARRLNIDYRKGQRSSATTASGRAPMYAVTLDKVVVGGIEVSNVRAGVIEGEFPKVPLLGMSFLGELEIQKKGKQLTLRQ